MGFLRGRLGSQIGRFLRGKIVSYILQKLAFLTLLKTNFLFFFFFFGGGGGGGGGGGEGGATVLLCNCPGRGGGGGGVVPLSYYATVQWNCHCIKGNNLWPSHIGNGIKEH